MSTGVFRWVKDVIYVSDKPGKNEQTKGLKGRGYSTNALIDLIRNAKESIVIQTPYLVTTELSHRLFAEAKRRGVRIQILTNSLATTDNIAAFRGYQVSRSHLLEAGVELFEFRPDAQLRRMIMTSSFIRTIKELPIFGIHAKTMVVDEKILVVGTFNLDPRSAHLNTECVTLIPDENLSQQVLRILNLEMKPENSWQTTPKFNPDKNSPWSLRFKTWMSGIVPTSLL